MKKRTRIPFAVWLLAGVGLVTLAVLAMRYAVVPFLVILGGTL